jgi:hypothetical protein
MLQSSSKFSGCTARYCSQVLQPGLAATAMQKGPLALQHVRRCISFLEAELLLDLVLTVLNVYFAD